MESDSPEIFWERLCRAKGGQGTARGDWAGESKTAALRKGAEECPSSTSPQRGPRWPGLALSWEQCRESVNTGVESLSDGDLAAVSQPLLTL